MTKYHVDLGDPPVDEMPAPPPGKLGRARAFETFKSLKKAVRFAQELYRNGEFARPDIIDDDGNPVNIDWDGTEWLTKAELITRLNAAETSRQGHRKTIDKLHEEAAARDNEMIRAGYIPVRTLAPHLLDALITHNGGNARDFFPRDFHPMETTYKLVFRQFAANVGKEQHPFITAMKAIADRSVNK